jgi:GNAT superfamily N-acetyltransferase
LAEIRLGLFFAEWQRTGGQMVSHIETNPEGFADHAALLALLREAFAYMAGRIDPPSSLARMTGEDIARKAATEDLFLARDGARPVACLFGRAAGGVYAIGKMAVAGDRRGTGLARALVAAAENRARVLGLPALELQSRVELTENHAIFAALGFTETGQTAHPGHRRPTSVTFRRPV